MRWTQAQAAVIANRHCNLAVYAGPGSGKTTVLIEHLAATLRDGVDPGGCMAVTYTREAAREVRDRLQRQRDVSRTTAAVRVGTIHAQVFRWLVAIGHPVQIILSEREHRALVAQALHAVGLSASRASDWIQQLTVLQTVPGSGQGREQRRLLAAYQRLKRAAGRWDFEDILLAFEHVLATTPGRLRKLPLSHLWVDEFQDVDCLQWAVLNELRRQFDAPMFVVGDDDQAIYGFRGGDPAWLLRFPSLVPDTASHVLSANFRSGRTIVHAAARLIGHAKQRMEKPVEVRSGLVGRCTVFHWKNEDKEVRAVSDQLRRVSTSAHPRSVAVLARTRAQLAAVWTCVPAPLRCMVEFRTFHEAKGREWDEVHVVGMVDRNPYLADPDDNGEEERRLIYVAMTRARHHLVLHVPYRLRGSRCTASRYLSEAGLV